jgi:hypothetical protein
MKLEVDITRQDYLNYNVYHFIKTQLTQTIIIGLVGLVILQYAMNKDESSLNIISLIFSSLLYISIFCVIMYYNIHKTRLIPRDDGAFLGKKSYEFLDDHIYFKDKHSEGQIQWSAIKHLGNSKKAFYLGLETNMAIMIPKRHFSDKAEEERFHSLVQGKLNGG